MLAGLKKKFLSSASAAGETATAAVDKVSEHAAAAKTSASEYTLVQLKQALEGSREKMSEAPDVYVTIVKVELQDGMKVNDLFDFRLSGLKCRVRLDVHGTAAQLAAMLAAGATLRAAETVGKLTGLGTGKVGEALEGIKGTTAAKAAEGEETKSVEFDINLDLGVRKAGEEVDAVVTIGKDLFAKIDKIIPVSKATKYVQDAISRRVKEIITNWAKNKAKGKAKDVLGETGYSAAKSGVKTTKAAYGTVTVAAAGAAGAAAGALGKVNETLFEEKPVSKENSGASSRVSL